MPPSLSSLSALRKIHPQIGLLRRRPESGEALKPSRVEALDALLEGGFKPGRLVEIVGPRSGGRFSTVLQTLATFTRRGEVAALVDLGDGFDLRTGLDSGIDLARLLWARPAHLKTALIATELLLNTGFPLVVLDLGLPPVPGGRGSEGSWIRLARAAQKHHGVLLISTPYRASGTTAQTVVTSSHVAVGWRGSGKAPRLLNDLSARLELTKAIGRAPTFSQELRRHCGALAR